ncbi:MAG: SpoIIE family protein phosphatase [Bacteroidia bacterium]|nr:SpoIIE family protein phosphatase [Bacteroidia bacterium]
MKISVRWKLFFFVIGFNIAVIGLLTYFIYDATYKIFFSSYKENKLTFAKSIAGGIDGDIHKNMDSLCDTRSREYQHMFHFLKKMKDRDSSITYLYTANYNKKEDKFYYCVDGDISKENIFWVETDDFAFEIHFDSTSQPFYFYNGKEYINKLKISTDSFEIQISVSGNIIYFNEYKYAEIISHNPFKVKVDSITLDSLSRNITHIYTQGNNNLKLLTSISFAGGPYSIPGDLLQDIPENIKKYKRIIDSGEDYIDSSLVNTIYGKCISAYGVIKDSNNVPVGLVFVDMYENELKTLEKTVTWVSIIISVLSILIVLLVLPFILEKFVIRKIKRLNKGINQMSEQQFDTQILINSRDEFENLANGFNYMAKNLKSFYESLEQKVRERTATIEQQNEEIKTQNDQLEYSNNEITKQKQKVEEINNEITASIVYARKIQTAILQTSKFIDKWLPENFILFKPRDIVSGDFFYIQKIQDTIFIIAADCTGHGVPGAFMSMLGVSFLNEIILKERIVKTDIILNNLRDQIKFALQQTKNNYETQDGMDISCVSLNEKNGLIQFSGANNPIWIFKESEDADSSFIEIKGDRMPVGIHPNDNIPFTLNEYQLNIGDSFYLFSDGYASQFGGQKNEKLKTKKFREFITEVNKLPMCEQKEVLNKKIIEWKGKCEQTDDILVIGVKYINN